MIKYKLVPGMKSIQSKKLRGIGITPVPPKRLMNTIESKWLAGLKKHGNECGDGLKTRMPDALKGVITCTAWMLVVIAKFIMGRSRKWRLVAKNASDHALLRKVCNPGRQWGMADMLETSRIRHYDTILFSSPEVRSNNREADMEDTRS